MTIVEHTLFRLCIALVQSAKYLVYVLIGCFNVLIGILLMLQDFQLMIFHRCLKQDFGIGAPRIAVLSLNPHAGDGGLLGMEEQG